MDISYPSLKGWFLQNQTTKQIFKGRFPAQNLTMNIKPNWATHTALSRTKEIQQFLNQSADTLSFRVLLRDNDAYTGTTQKDFDLLTSWARPDPIYGNRPPTLTFWVGKGWASMDCVIDGITDITFDEPNSLGAMQGVSFNVNLRAHATFSLQGGAVYETRYHRALIGDYFEYLAYREYQTPMLGVIIRNRHPKIFNVQVGDVIKLPSVEAIRTIKIQPQSIPFATMLGKKRTPQKIAVENAFTNRSSGKISHVV
jgi:hypothetical protein